MPIELWFAFPGSFLGIFSSTLFTVSKGENKVVDVVIWGINIGVFSSLLLGISGFFEGPIDWDLLGGMKLWVGGLGLMVSVSYGLREGLMCKRLSYLSVIVVAILAPLLFFDFLYPDRILLRSYFILALVLVSVSIPGTYLGNLWAMRQSNR